MSTSPDTLSTVRRAVRSVVEGTPELGAYPRLRRNIAERMVGVSLAAAELIAEEQRLSQGIAQRVRARSAPAAPARAPLAEGQAAGDIHRRTATSSAAGVLQATRDAIDFPGFVTSLITGVFQSIQTSNIQQLQAFSELLDAVNSTTSDFAVTQITPARAAAWAVSHFPVFHVETVDGEPTMSLTPDAEMPSPEELQRVLGATREEAATITEHELTETLLPVVQRKLAKDRQSMLATMVLMGLQRVIVDDGHIHASMRLRVDARSIAEQRQAEQTDMRLETEASGKFGMGAWGASAKVASSIGYVQSDDQLTREDIGVSAALRSSVDVRFRTAPLDLTRLASSRTLQEIQDRSMVPGREEALGSTIANNPTGITGITGTPQLPKPAGAGSLLGDDAGTQQEAADAQRAAAARQAGAASDNSASAGGDAATTNPDAGES